MGGVDLREEIPKSAHERDADKWSELIEIMNELSDYRAHFVVLLARSYLKLERAGK